jgi:ABC-type transport system involved in multi-copper enzyme maturation permease subunit
MATIREKGYYHWDGRLEERRLPWWPITRTGIQLAFRKKWFKFVFSIGFAPAVVSLVLIYISERLEDFKSMFGGKGQLITVDPKFFMNFLTNGGLVFIIVMVLVFAGAGLIADDLKHNSLQVYFARPLKKKDYLIGKMAVIVFFVLILTFAPAVVLYLFKLIFAGSFRFVGQYPALLLSVAAFSAVLTVFFAFYTLLLSALSKNSRYVMVIVFMVYLFSQILFGILNSIRGLRGPATALVSIYENLLQVAAFLFGQTPPHAVHPGWSFLVLGAVCAASAVVLAKKIRGVEVIR